MMTAEQFWEPHLAVGEVAEMLPEVGSKFVRNVTDRGLVELASLPGGRPGLRLYSLKNVIELRTMWLVSTAGAPLPEARLIAGAIATRAEMRIAHGTLGTSQDLLTMVYVIGATKARGMKRTGQTLTARWRSQWDAQLAWDFHDLWKRHPFAEIRLFPADEMIEDAVSRFKTWQRTEHEGKSNAETKAA